MSEAMATRDLGGLSLGERIPEILRKVREQAPLVHHITNVVVTNITANVTLAVGAPP